MEPPYSEKELLMQVAEGDEKAFRQVFELYAKLLYPFLFRTVKSSVLAEELIQEVMLRVWINRDKLPGINYPRQWIFKIATNLAFTSIQRKITEGQAIDTLSKQVKETENLESDLQLRELKRHIREAVNKLPVARRRIYQLSREEGMSRDEIASHLQISPSTVKNSIVSALKFIREHLEKKGYLVSLFFLWIKQ